MVRAIQDPFTNHNLISKIHLQTPPIPPIPLYMPQAPPLLDKTLALLAADKRKLSVIAKEAGVAYFWLRNLKMGITANPGVTQVQTLHDYYQSRVAHV